MYGFEKLLNFYGIEADLSAIEKLPKDEAFEKFASLLPNVFEESDFTETEEQDDFYVNWRIDLDEYREGKCPYFVRDMFVKGDKILYVQVKDTERYKIDKDNKVWKMTSIHDGSSWLDTCPLMPHELVHCWILRNGYHLDCLGMTKDLDKFLADFKFYGDMEIQSFDNLHDFIQFARKEAHYPIEEVA